MPWGIDRTVHSATVGTFISVGGDRWLLYGQRISWPSLPAEARDTWRRLVIRRVSASRSTRTWGSRA
jgi:hypothetical protein